VAFPLWHAGCPCVWRLASSIANKYEFSVGDIEHCVCACMFVNVAVAAVKKYFPQRNLLLVARTFHCLQLYSSLLALFKNDVSKAVGHCLSQHRYSVTLPKHSKVRVNVGQKFIFCGVVGVRMRN